MSLMDKIKSMFSGGSQDADAHAGHDHDDAGHDHSHEPVAESVPPADPAATPAPPEEGEDRPA